MKRESELVDRVHVTFLFGTLARCCRSKNDLQVMLVHSSVFYGKFSGELCTSAPVIIILETVRCTTRQTLLDFPVMVRKAMIVLI